MVEQFDERLLQRQSWEPLYVKGDGEELSRARLHAATELLIFQILGEKHALLTSEMVLYHVAQGALGGVPFVVSFCCVCHSGAQFSPSADGKQLTFQCGGLYHGTAILRDLETDTLWHHMTGHALHGSLVGTTLVPSSLQVTTVAAALRDDPSMRLHRSRPWTVLGPALTLGARIFQATGLLPPVFTKTLPEEDFRLPRMTLGLGLRVGGEARFYEMSRLKLEAWPMTDTIGDESVTIKVDNLNGIPFAVDSSGQRPLQFFLRWYGFALTYPHCTVWQPA